MYVTKVKGNVKAGADLELGEKTLVVGPNGSGKSTIVNIIELALTSRAGDIAGRTDIAREADVMSLVRNGEKTLYAEVQFDGGEKASYAVEGTTAKAKKASVDRPDRLAHEDILPIRNLREALLGSPQTARKFLMGKVGGGTLADVEALIPAPLLPVFRAAAANYPMGTPVADVLVGIIDYAGKQSREATATAKASREAAKLVAGGRMAPPTNDEIALAKKRLDATRASLDLAETMLNIESEIANISAEIQRTERRADEIAVKLHDRKAKLNAMKVPAEIPEILRHLLPVVEESLTEGECLACGGQPPSESASSEIKAFIAANTTGRVDYDALAAEVKALSAEATGLLTTLDELVLRERELIAKRGAPVNLPALTRADAEAEYALEELRTAKNAWAAVQKAEASAIDADRQQLEWKSLKEACESAMAMTLDKALTTFIAKVQGYLPKTDTFDLRLRDGDREVVQFGFIRDGALHTALSGAEWARVMAAMASACVPEGQYACIIPEERAFDATTLKDVLTALGTSPHQVILTSPVAPRSVPKGWTVVRRGE